MKTPKKAIAYVIPSSTSFLRHHFPLAVEAAKHYDVHAILTHDNTSGNAADTAEISRNGITPHSIQLTRKSGNPFRVLRETSVLRRLFSEIRPDLINAINLKAVLTAALANRRLGIPLVGTIPGLGYMFTGDSLRQRMLRVATVAGLRHTLARQKHFLVLSNQDDVDELSRRRVTAKEKMGIVPVPGVDTEQYSVRHEPGSGFRVLLPARMLWDKGVGEFVEAAKILSGKIPGAEFILAGEPDEGNPASISRQQLEEWSRSEVVSWIGHCSDMPAKIAACHVVCLPSYREGFPRSLVEAMACGRAVVTTDTPGCREIGEEAGLIVPGGMSDKLAEGIFRLYEDPGLRMEKGRAGRKIAMERFAVEVITRQMIGYYEDMLR